MEWLIDANVTSLFLCLREIGRLNQDVCIYMYAPDICYVLYSCQLFHRKSLLSEGLSFLMNVYHLFPSIDKIR